MISQFHLIQKQVWECHGDRFRMGMSSNGLAWEYVGNHHRCQTSISPSLCGAMRKAVPELQSERSRTFTPPRPPSPSTPAVRPSRPLLLPLPNPTLFPHRSREDTVEANLEAIHHSRLSSRVHSSGNTFQTGRLECDWGGEGQWKNDGGVRKVG